MTIVFLILLLFLLIFLAVPICWAIGIVGVIGLIFVDGNPMTMIPQCLYSGINYYTLIAVPFFVFAGELMNKGGITTRLIRLSKLIIGRIPASLAHVNILSSMFFGGITGSAQADTSCVGGILIPAMVEDGYTKEEAVAVTASSSCIGPIIPPSIIMVLYGSTMNVSIGKMFMGALIPGVMVGLGLMGVVMIRDRKYHFPRSAKKYTGEEAKKIIIDALIPLGMPIILMGGILGGIFTATEAGAIAVLYSLIIALFFLKTVTWKDVIGMLKTSGQTTASILMIVGCSKILSWVMALLHISEIIGTFFHTFVSSKILFLLLINIFLLMVGTFMDASASLILLAPILAPLAAAYGVDPVHFGIIMCINLVIGHATPPLGLCLFIGCKIGKVSLAKGGRAILPYVLGEVVILLCVTYIPWLTSVLPGLMM